MGFATLTAGGLTHTITRGEVSFPRWGVWCARVELDRGDAALVGKATIALGDLKLQGTIRRGTVYQGQSSYLVFGGADGWRRTVPQGSNQVPSAKLSRIAQDVARLVGETVVVGAGIDRAVGSYVRFEGPASRVLSRLAPQAWWVDADGITQIGPRPTGAATPAILDYIPEQKRVRIAEEENFPMPGQTVEIDGVARAIDSVTHCVNGSIRSELWLALGSGPGDLSRLLAPLRSIVKETLPDVRYYGVYEYSVHSVNGTDYELDPTDGTIGVPAAHAKLRPGIPGLTQAMAVGALVLVAFINGDPTRPFIQSVPGPDDAGFTPTSLGLDCSGAMTIGASASAVHVGADDPVLAAGGERGRFIRTGDTLLLPVGAAGTPTPYVLFHQPGTPMSTVQK